MSIIVFVSSLVFFFFSVRVLDSLYVSEMLLPSFLPRVWLFLLMSPLVSSSVLNIYDRLCLLEDMRRRHQDMQELLCAYAP